MTTQHNLNIFDRDMQGINNNELFTDQLARLRIITAIHSNKELAAFLGIHTLAVSAAIRRRKIPAEWLLIIMRAKNVNPEWVLTGKGPYYVFRSSENYETGDEAMAKWADEIALKRLSSKALADELLRRIAVAQTHSFCSKSAKGGVEK